VVVNSSPRAPILPNSSASGSGVFSRHRRFLLYCLLGLMGVATDLTAYWVMANWLSFHHQLANVLSTFAGILTSFSLNAAYTFQMRDRLLLRFAAFAAVGLIGLALSAGTLYLLVDRLQVDKNWAKAACVYVVLVQYNLNRLISFRR
jgi:putative flippase GtrA